MNAIPYGGREEDFDLDEGGGFDSEMPRRPRRQFFNKWSALLLAVILGGVGFYVGVRVEKGQLASSSSAGGLASAFASRFGGAGGTGASGASSTSATSSASRASGSASRFGGGGFGGFGGAGGGTIGTVSTVDGNTLYVTTTSGNTVKVTLSGATTIKKEETVGKSKIDPGDSIVIAGASNSKGTVAATSVTDSGARATGSTTGGSSGSSSAGSAVSSLF